MKVALITDGISPYVLGGMQKHSYYLAKYFSKNGISVDLIHFNNSEYDISKLECFTEEERKYINSIIIEFPKSKKIPGHYIYNSYHYSCLAFDEIKNKLDTYGFIYTKGFSGWKLISEKQKGNIHCCNIGVNFHGYEMFQHSLGFIYNLKQMMLKPFVKYISKHADVVFSYGENISNIIIKLGVNKKRIIEIPSGVETNFIANKISEHSESITKFVFLGRAEKRKGIEELNVAINSITDLGLKFQFEFIGPIPETLKISNKNILYHGEIRDAEKIKHILQQADVLVCASWSEGFPNVILEAMANGLAIIATNVGAISSMVSELNGWLIKPFNQQELVDALVNAVKDETLKSKKEHSLDLIKNKFNWDIISNQLISEIKKLQ